MEDSASNIPSIRETESIWVWMKPASFYNTLDYRYQQNKYLLRRCLSYRQKKQQKQENGLGQLDVEFGELTRAISPMFGIDKKRPMRVSIIVAMCDSDGERDFHPFEAKRVHLKKHDCVSITLNVHQQPSTLLLIVRGIHQDMSILSPQAQSQDISATLTKKWCFGCIPVGEFVWWTAHPMPNTCGTKVKVTQWNSGVVTLGAKSTWDGYQERQTTLLSIARSNEEHPTGTGYPCLFTIHCSRRPVTTTSNVPRIAECKSSGFTSTKDEVAFRFVYGITQPQCVEQRTQQYGCPFCLMKCGDLLGLRYHLAASHDLFIYEIETGSNLTVIWVRRRTEIYDHRGDIFCPITKQLISAHEKAFYMNKAAYLRAKPVSKRQRGECTQAGLYFDDLETTGGTVKRRTPFSASKPSSPSKAMLS